MASAKAGAALSHRHTLRHRGQGHQRRLLRPPGRDRVVQPGLRYRAQPRDSGCASTWSAAAPPSWRWTPGCTCPVDGDFGFLFGVPVACTWAAGCASTPACSCRSSWATTPTWTSACPSTCGSAWTAARSSGPMTGIVLPRRRRRERPVRHRRRHLAGLRRRPAVLAAVPRHRGRRGRLLRHRRRPLRHVLRLAGPRQLPVRTAG